MDVKSKAETLDGQPRLIGTFGIRDKLRSQVLKDLASKRTGKGKFKLEDPVDSESSDDDNNKSELERRATRAKYKNSLLSILPQPKNSSTFGPTVNIERLMNKAVEEEDAHPERSRSHSPAGRVADDGMIEVDVSKVVGDVSQTLIKELTVEKSRTQSVPVPKGKEKQKNQITYLAQLSKATQLERKEQAAQSRLNKAAARSKYGW